MRATPSSIESASWTSMPEEQQIAISVLDFKSPQTVMVVAIHERQKELDVPRREFGRQGIRIWNRKKSVPAGNALFDVFGVVRRWFDTNGLHDDRRAASFDNAEEDVVRLGPLKRDLEPESVAVKRQRGGDIPDDEERCDARDFWFVTFRFPWG